MTKRLYPDSLTHRVTELARQHGKATVSDVLAAYPEYSRKQVNDAFANAQYRGDVKVILRGSFQAHRESVWAPTVERPNPIDPNSIIRRERAQPAASVWELGTPVIGSWPPTFEGGRSFNLLGPWTDPDDSASNDSRKAA